jgi:glyoxylase-like metal-dependent hydrolase (beta-lactamase superfamily II)
MRIHHLSCGTCCPVGGQLFDGTTEGAFAHMVCHCLLIETEAGLVLVDTGFGTRDIAHPTQRISPFFLNLCNVQLRPEETAISQLRARGFDPADVRHIVITHLDFDHAGGIEDFPNATVHITSRERDVALAGRGGAFVGPRRYRPQQWDEVIQWQLYPFGGGERWFGFDAVRDLRGLPPEILLVPLSGHTWGHCGVAVQSDDGWLLHAGDAYFFRGEVGSEHPTCPPGMAGYQRLMEVDRRARLTNQARLRRLSIDHADEVRVFCAHDRVEFDILRGA